MAHGPIATESLLERLHWRYAVKKFDPARRIPDGPWRALEEALVLTASSYGVQPWKFVVVTDRAVRERLLPASWNQRQVVDASHLVVFCIKKNLTAGDVDAFVARTAEVRGVPAASLSRFRDMMVGDLIEGPRSRTIDVWASNQVFIALGNFLTCAALLGIDACPMEGFEPAKYDEILGLPAKGLASAVLATAGYRAADDKYAALPKVRFRVDEVIERV